MTDAWLERTLADDYTVVAYADEARRELGLDIWCVLNGTGCIMGSMGTLAGAVRLVLILTGASVHDLPQGADQS